MQTQRTTYGAGSTIGAGDAPPMTDGQRLLRWAVAGTLLVNVVGVVPFFFLPGADEAPAAAVVIGLVLAAVALAGAWGLWQGRRWGSRVTVTVTALNLLSSAPAIAAWPSAAVGVTVIIGVAISVVLLALLRRPGLRAELR